MKSKILAMFLVLGVLLTSFVACGKSDAEKAADERRKNLKIGVLLSGDENDSYNGLHLDGFNKAHTSLEIGEEKVVVKQSVKQEDCYQMLTTLVVDGCNLIFSAGSGIEDYVIQAATENTDINFCYADGYKSEDLGLDNYHNFGIATYQARYLSGIVAGYKLNDMLENGEISESQFKIGYVGSVPGSQSRSDYTAFYLGVKSICPSATMQVQYSGLEKSKNLESIAANALMANGVVMIAQQSYYNGAAETCEKYGKVFIGCDFSVAETCPNTALTSTKIDWTAIYKHAIETYIKDGKLPVSWSKSAVDDSIGICDINKTIFADKNNAEKAKSKVEEIIKKMKDDSFKVFDTTKWTVDGKKVNSTAIGTYSSVYNSKEYIIKPGYFAECEKVSYPQFNFVVDCITELN